MRLGFDFFAAKSKKDTGQDAPSRAPMAPRGSSRINPSAEDKKVRRQMARTAKENVVNLNRREAALLAEMPGATLERQRQIAAELDQIGRQRVAAAHADRELDLAGAVVDRTMTPVVTAALHTTATDWMDPQVGTPDAQAVQQAMTAAASQWFMRTHAAVKADPEEYQIQAEGAAMHLAGSHAPLQAIAADAFLRHAMFLNRQAASAIVDGKYPVMARRTAADQVDGATGPNGFWCRYCGDYQSVRNSHERKAMESHMQKHKDAGHTPKKSPAEGGSPFPEKNDSQRVSYKTAADADINPYPANEQAGYAESGLPAAVPVEGYDIEGEENGALDNFAPPVAPENAGAVAQEGQAVPMPGFGEQVTSAVDAGFRHIDVPVWGFQTASQREAQVHAAAIDWTLTYSEPNWVTDDGDVATTPNGTIPMEYVAKVPEGELRVYNVIGGWLWQINGPDEYASPLVEFDGANGDPFGPRDGLTLEEAKKAAEKAYAEWSGKTAAREASRRTAASYGEMAACKVCGSDIQFLGDGWYDRGSNTYCDESGQHPLIDGGDGGYGDYPHVKHSPVTAARRTAADWREELQPLLEEQALAGPRPIADIAWEIQADWKNVNYGAVPYLDAMKQLTSVTDYYGADDARGIIAYFLSNATSWRGEKAKAIKAELKAMIGRKASKTAASGAKAIAIYPDKRVEEVTISDYKDGQAIVGGYIEPVNLSDGSTMWVNEEYLYSFGPDDVNWIASDVCGLGGRPEFMLRQPILGPVYITGPNGPEGETTDVTDQARRWVQSVGREAGARFAARVVHAAGGPADPSQGEVPEYDEWYPDEPQPYPFYNAACPNCGEAHEGQCPYPWMAQHDARRRMSSVSLTNVSFEGGIGSNVGVGTDPQGNRVRFRLSDQDARDLASVLTGDLGMNFSGVDVDEADIIKTSSAPEGSREWAIERGVKPEHYDLASTDAGLGVGHDWTNKNCMAYRTFDPADCTCIADWEVGKRQHMAAHRHAGTDPDDQNGNAETALPTPETNTDTMWPWELPEGDVQTGEDAADVAGVPTPSTSGYPQPTAARTAAAPEISASSIEDAVSQAQAQMGGSGSMQGERLFVVNINGSRRVIEVAPPVFGPRYTDLGSYEQFYGTGR